MTDHTNTPDPTRPNEGFSPRDGAANPFDPDTLFDTDTMSNGARLRAAADGEIGAEHVRPSETDAVAFERRLREAVGRVMGSDSDYAAPEGLADRVRAAIARDQIAGAIDTAETPETPETPETVETGAVGPERVASRTRSRSFWSRPVVAAGAGMAAVLAAMVGLVVVNGSGPIGNGLGNALGIGQGPVATADGYTVRLARFVADEHARVTASEAVAREKLRVHAQDDAVERMIERLGAPGAISDVEIAPDALRFQGLGDCNVPSNGPSCHSQFTLVGDSGRQTTVSLFLKRAEGRLDLEPGVTYEVDTAACGVTGARIIVWTDGEIVHMLVAEDPDGSICDSVLREMGLPTPTVRLL